MNTSRQNQELDDERIPVVPFVAWRCPKCGDRKPRTYSQRGRIRLHLCQRCGIKYRSLELDDPSEWRPPGGSTAAPKQ